MNRLNNKDIYVLLENEDFLYTYFRLAFNSKKLEEYAIYKIKEFYYLTIFNCIIIDKTNKDKSTWFKDYIEKDKIKLSIVFKDKNAFDQQFEALCKKYLDKAKELKLCMGKPRAAGNFVVAQTEKEKAKIMKQIERYNSHREKRRKNAEQSL